MPAEAVVEDRIRVAVRAPSPLRRLLRRRLDERRRARPIAVPRGEDHRAVDERLAPGRLRENAGLLHEVGRGIELPVEQEIPRNETEREMEMPVCARGACGLQLAVLKDEHRLVVPELERDDVTRPRAGERQPPVTLLAG